MAVFSFMFAQPTTTFAGSGIVNNDAKVRVRVSSVATKKSIIRKNIVTAKTTSAPSNVISGAQEPTEARNVVSGGDEPVVPNIAKVRVRNATQTVVVEGSRITRR